MKCESVRRQLTAYLDGELEDDRGSAVRGHLRSCAACRQVASDEAALRDGLRALPPIDPPASLWAGVQQRLAAAEVADAQRPAWRRVLARWAPRVPQVSLAGAVVAAAVVLLVLRVQRDDERAPAKAAIAIAPPVVAPDHGRAAPSREPRHQEDDVTADLAAEPARITASYAATTRELLELVKEARAQWSDEQKREFDAQLALLQKHVALAVDERPRRDAYRKLIRYLQRAVIAEDIALASVGGAR